MKTNRKQAQVNEKEVSEYSERENIVLKGGGIK